MNLNIIKVVLDRVKVDSTLESIFKHAKNPHFFIDAIKHNSYYTVPPAYEKDGIYYILGFYRSLDAIRKIGETEISVNIIELTEAKILEFLFCFQYQEHKETRCMAEMIRVFLNFKEFPSGKDWLKRNVSSSVKEKQVSELFGISTFGAKCYLKLLQPANKEFLEKLSDDYSLYAAYMDCLGATHDSKQNTSSPHTSRNKNATSSQPESPRATSSTDPSRNETDPSAQPVVIPNTLAKQSTSIRKMRAEQPEEIMSEGQLDTRLQQFRSPKHVATDDEHSQPPFAKKAIVVLQDDTCIEMPGKIDIFLDNIAVGSTEQLTKKSDGTWSLPKHSTPVTLMVYSDDEDDDFFSEF